MFECRISNFGFRISDYISAGVIPAASQISCSSSKTFGFTRSEMRFCSGVIALRFLPRLRLSSSGMISSWSTRLSA